MGEFVEFFDETCLSCDSYDIIIHKGREGIVDYSCRECGHVWSNNTDYE